MSPGDNEKDLWQRNKILLFKVIEIHIFYKILEVASEELKIREILIDTFLKNEKFEVHTAER